ncbi:MAG: MurR/RpiR family transcriptional regulator [Gammaproteobacteria bacterium]|nr:MurR/RpiR family transcriptional regulator [Gammaproteobacteria bacterium]
MSTEYDNLPLLARMKATQDSLPRAQQQVLALMLSDPQTAVNLSINQLATCAKVSMPTIMRTARSFGFAGVRQFKLALAQDLARQTPVHRSVDLQDTSATVVQKIMQGVLASIQMLEAQFDVATLERAADMLAKAVRIDCYSVGATSGFLANDMQGRLFRLGLVAHAFHDAHLQLTSAASQSESGVVLVFSHIGRMPSMLEAVAFAKSRGTQIIAVTQPGTPLALQADIVLAANVPPDAIMRVGTEAYIAHLLIIEILTVLVLQRLGAQAVKHLSNFRQVLQEHGQDTETHPSLHWNWSQVERQHEGECS